MSPLPPSVLLLWFLVCLLKPKVVTMIVHRITYPKLNMIGMGRFRFYRKRYLFFLSELFVGKFRIKNNLFFNKLLQLF